MAGDKTYITDSQGKQHRATRVHAVTPTDIVWSSNPNDYAVQVLIDGKWHRAILTYDVSGASYFDNVNIDKALIVGADGKNHTALIVSSEAAVTLSSIKTDEHALVNGTTTGETAVCTYTEAWGNIEWEDNANVYKVIVTGSDGKKHTALLTTSASGGVQAIVMGVAPLVLPDALATSIVSLIAYGGTEQGLPDGYTQLEYIVFDTTQVIDTGFTPDNDSRIESKCYRTGEDCWFYGAGPNNPRITLYHSRTETCRWGYQSRSNVGFVADTEYTIIEDKNGLNINGVDNPWTSGTTDDFTCDRSLTIGNNNGSTGTRYFAGNLYYMKIYDNGVLARDFVPCKNASNVVGLYDRVNGVFYTDTGLVAGPNVVPTPNAPIDIVCNNGVLKARHQSGLPLGYQLLSSLTSDGRCLVNTGVVLQEGDEIDLDYSLANPQPASLPADRFLLGTANTDVSKGGTWTEVYSGSGDISSAAWYVRFSSPASVNGNLPASTLSGHLTLKQGQLIINDTIFLTPDYVGTFQTTALTFFGRYDANMANYKGAVMTVSHFTVKNGNTYRFNGVMVKRLSDNALGVYDLVSDTFCGNIGDGTFTAGTAVSDPVEVYTTGPIETIAIKDSNSSVVSTATTEILLSVDTYTDQQEVISGSVARKCGAVVLDSSFEWTYDSTYGRVNATIPNLWGSTVARTVPGLCTHFKWLSHQESISSITAGQCYSAGANRIFLHISQTSASAFSAWLDAQKSAGTPVIIVFPLETATTDSVAGQTMSTAAGDNTAEITQAGMAGLELEVTYMKGA